MKQLEIVFRYVISVALGTHLFVVLGFKKIKNDVCSIYAAISILSSCE